MAVILGFGIGTVILAIVIAWGLRQYNSRNRANDAVTDAATKELYEHPDRYESRTRDEFKKQIRP